MTLSTVGQDMNPETFLGQALGGLCALAGVFILTLPIPIVVNSFASYYKNRMWRNEVKLRKRERLREQALQKKQMQKLFLLKAMAAPGVGVVATSGKGNNSTSEDGSIYPAYPSPFSEEEREAQIKVSHYL
ncbi:potassium voltage-gated channel protein Shaw [Eurytemora carolleeae]|uniref:potassium voltage-gated channel protein Shaw n=1 Tax=Eurytemora carolleeae TaxID=1294199 RepID=UPI000C775DB9|nr:potassium voltage-gated channel protein Shaw [Eurytemora carolleeae]|eukprot:XP_023335025.1 potassium voltage-gated channel protein Shaw-like [Eurytemora affinis]